MLAPVAWAVEGDDAEPTVHQRVDHGADLHCVSQQREDAARETRARVPAADKDLTAFAETIESERGTGNPDVARHLDEQFGLPAPLTTTTAADILWTATSFEVADRLVRRCGWTREGLEDWLGDVVVSSLAPRA